MQSKYSTQMKYLSGNYCAVFIFAFSSYSNEIINFTDKRELFVNHHLIDSLKNTRLILHGLRDKDRFFVFVVLQKCCRIKNVNDLIQVNPRLSG
jgi:hypothetical protein